jgi:hypothetical protein
VKKKNGKEKGSEDSFCYVERKNGREYSIKHKKILGYQMKWNSFLASFFPAVKRNFFFISNLSTRKKTIRMKSLEKNDEKCEKYGNSK